VSASPYVVNVATIIGKPGSMRELELALTVPDRIGEGLMYVPEGSPLDVKVRLETLHDGILATAEVVADAEGTCARCLAPIEETLRVDFAELFAYSRGEDLEYEVHDDTVDLEPPIRDAVVLALPFQPLDRPDCPGLDPATGEKLTEPLPEEAAEVDPRWAALASFETSAPPREEPAATGHSEEADER